MQEIAVTTRQRVEFIDITAQVEKLVAAAAIQEGICLVYCPHTTAAVTINENADPDVSRDIMHKLNQLIPPNEHYRHREGNADAHIKSSLIGNTQSVIVINGRMQLGTWQGLYFCEFDGPRRRKVWITVK